jgi:GxxExxY protein
MKYSELSYEEEKIGKAVVNAAFKLHKSLGPGLLEKVYEVCMAHELSKAGYKVKRQVKIPIVYDGIEFEEGLRLDMLINDQIIIELKAVDIVNPVWKAQIISHLKLTELRLGYLINFNVSLIKNGIKRFKNSKSISF